MKKVKILLKKLGLEEVDIEIYLFLMQNGPSTILQISKSVKENRTSLYRRCKHLSSKGFITKLSRRNTTKYTVLSINFLEEKVNEYEREVSKMEEEFLKIKEELKTLWKKQSFDMNVIHYSGKEEAKQMVWNTLGAQKEVLSYGYNTLTKPLGRSFIKRWWRQCIEKNIVQKVIMNPQTLELKESKVNVDIPESATEKKEKIWHPRLIDKKEYEIRLETFIYNNVYSILQWEKNKIFGVEIYNSVLANQKRQEYKIIWEMASPV